MERVSLRVFLCREVSERVSLREGTLPAQRDTTLYIQRDPLRDTIRTPHIIYSNIFYIKGHRSTKRHPHKEFSMY